MLESSSTTTTVCFALLLLGPIACKHDDGRAAEQPSAHAEARTPDHANGASAVAETNDDHYDATSITRTGIQLDPNLVTACHVSDDEAFFAFDSTAVSSPAHDVLAEVAECVTNGPLHGKELELVGYTDPRGTDEYNEELGLMRAESVAKCLQEHGVKLDQLEINSMGETQASGDTSEWPSDRRVDIRVKPDVSASR